MYNASIKLTEIIMSCFKYLYMYASAALKIACVVLLTSNSAFAQTISESEKAGQLFEEIFEESLARYPEQLTQLGRAERLGEWNDLSEAFAAQTLEFNKAQLNRLNQLDYAELDQSTALSFDLLKQSLQEDIEDHQWRLYDYPVNQMFGTHSNVASLLINQHRVTDIESAQAYISRLNGVSDYFDQLIAGIEARTEANIIPPKFVFPHVIRDSQNLLKGAPFDDGEPNTLMADFSSKIVELAASDNSITEAVQSNLLKQAEEALLTSVKPAYTKLIDHLTELEKQANTDDGVWKWQNGDAFYNNALLRTTTTDLDADEIHQIGLNEVERIHQEMDEIRKQVEFDGDLTEFMVHMRESDEFYYADTEEGKARYLVEATALIEGIKSKLDDMFITQPKADLNVKAVEPFREKSAGKAFYNRPSEDGARPGIYYANLYDMKSMPVYQMEALAYHEGIPGHHMQIAISQELQDVPKFRKYGFYTAYVEGWGLYSEYLPKEYGLYSDPYSDFGRLAMELWRACRLVVDTGIHAKKWTRQEGIDYYVANTPNSELDAIKMVERHVVLPSQATAYKVGMLKILELREQAIQALGDDFDIRYFHDEILKYGAVPLNVLEDNIEKWIEKTKA